MELTTVKENLTAITGPAIARIVRKELMQAFPSIKFNVTGRTASAWSVLEGKLFVSWVDGPVDDKVEEIIGKYEGVRLCEDEYGNTYSKVTDNGDGTYYAVGSIVTDRSFSDAVYDAIDAKMLAVTGVKDARELERNFHKLDRAAIYSALRSSGLDNRDGSVSNYQDAVRFALHYNDYTTFNQPRRRAPGGLTTEPAGAPLCLGSVAAIESMSTRVNKMCKPIPGERRPAQRSQT